MPEQRMTFHNEIVPHVDAAFNLAWWLLRNKQDAEDAVQEAFLRAFRFFGDFWGGNGRAWLLKIVRNICYTWLQQNRTQPSKVEFDEEFFVSGLSELNPELNLLRNDKRKQLSMALEALSPHFREVLVLRELEGLSYKQISEVAEIPFGTVMSRLSRARGELREYFVALSRDFFSTAAGAYRHQRPATKQTIGEEDC